MAISGLGRQIPRKQIDDLVEHYRQWNQTPGISIAIVDDGKVVYSKGYGFADLENRVAAKPETVYRIGSLTKQFAAAIVLQLVREGKLMLDQSIVTVLPEAPKEWSGVTIQNLLDHTSGIEAYTDTLGFQMVKRDPMSTERFFDLIGKLKLQFGPGSEWKYDNSGYFLLGLIIERVTGHSFRDNLLDRICRPLGMTHTDLEDDEVIVPDRARGYFCSPSDPPVNASYLDMSWLFAAGGMVSTVSDLAKWDAALYGNAPLTQAELKESWTPTTLKNGTTAPYGFGWVISAMNGVPIYEHEGAIDGFNGDILRAPSERLTVIVLDNSYPRAITGPLSRDLAELVDPKLKPELKPITTVPPTRIASDQKLVEALVDGKLNGAEFTDIAKAALFPDAVKGVEDELNRLGAIFSFQPIDEKVAKGVDYVTYVAKVGFRGFKVSIGRTPEWKIAGFLVRPL